MIDIHTHLLPNVDDGSLAEDELSLAERIYTLSGFLKVYLTPHLNHPKFPQITKEKLVKAYEESTIKDSLLFELGSELYLGGKTITEFLPLGSSPFVLLELPLSTLPLYLMEAIFEIELRGYNVIIAHVERYEYFLENSLARRLKDRGAFFQVNISSIESGNENALYYFKMGMIDFIGTDAHSLEDLNGLEKIKWKKYNDILKRSADLLDIA